jgi:type I restriction enzyme M protein
MPKTAGWSNLMTYSNSYAKSTLSGASDMLRSAVGSNEAWEYLIPLVFLRILAEISENHEDKISFHNLLTEDQSSDIGNRINLTLYRICERNKSSLSDVFDGFDYQSNRLGQSSDRNVLLKGLLKKLSNVTCDAKDESSTQEAIHPCFNELLEELARKKQGAEIATPSSIANLIAQLLIPTSHETVYDPACGTGSLLSACYRHVEITENASCRIAGQEKNWVAWSIAKMSFYLQGIESSHVQLGDTIRAPKLLDSNNALAKFDVVVCNHPWGVKDWGYHEAQHDKFKRFSFGVPPQSNSEFAFILHALASMETDKGRAAVIVSNGALSRSGNEKNIRQRMVDANLVDAVISLPPKVFYNKDNSASILILRSNKKDKSILFINAEKCFSSTRDRNLLSQDGTMRILKTYHDRLNEPEFSTLIEHEEIAQKNYDLHVGIYVHSNITLKAIDLFALEQERLKVESELRAVEHELAVLLRKLGGKP